MICNKPQGSERVKQLTSLHDGHLGFLHVGVTAEHFVVLAVSWPKLPPVVKHGKPSYKGMYGKF